MSAEPTTDMDGASVVLALLEGYGRNEVSFGALMRGLTLFDGWKTVADPGGDDRVLTRLSDVGPWLDLFVTDARLEQHLAQIPRDVHLSGLTMKGALLAKFDSGIAGVHIHPGQDRSLILGQDRADLVRMWAETAIVEAMLMQRRDLDLTTLRDWRGWQLLVRTSPAEERAQLVLTADAHGRPVAAVFTADDCREAFLSRLPPAMRAGMSVRRMMGAQMFAQLAHMPVHGAAFNPAGPVPSRGYDRVWMERVVREG